MSSNLPEKQSSGRSAMPAQQQGLRGPFQSLLGWDPFRGVFPSIGNFASAMGMDVTRTEDGYNVEIPVPGFRPDDIEITFENDTLMVSGKSDRRNFTRVLELPDEVDPQNITAHVEQGLLCLHLSRRPETRPRRIPVTAGEGAHAQAATGTVQTTKGETTEQKTQPAASKA